MALTSVNLQTEDVIERCAYLLRDSPTNDKYRELMNRSVQSVRSTEYGGLYINARYN